MPPREKIRISAVSYANTYPLLYGLYEHPIREEIVVSTDPPAVCADKVKAGEADLGLVPVVEYPSIPGARIISPFCIGADGLVRTVCLYHQKPLEQVDTVYLDTQSRTSVALTKVLMKRLWKRRMRYQPLIAEGQAPLMEESSAVLLIGDKCFEAEQKYPLQTDLSESWKELTGMPFVFACWIANRSLPDGFEERLSEALQTGVQNTDQVIGYFRPQNPLLNGQLKQYLEENIKYNFGTPQREAMERFLSYVKEDRL